MVIFPLFCSALVSVGIGVTKFFSLRIFCKRKVWCIFYAGGFGYALPFFPSKHQRWGKFSQCDPHPPFIFLEVVVPHWRILAVNGFHLAFSLGPMDESFCSCGSKVEIFFSHPLDTEVPMQIFCFFFGHFE